MTTDRLADILERIPSPERRDHRFVVGIAGPPAGGKSTLAEQLDDHLGERAARLGLDAFQFDNSILFERGHRPRKGAPFTFDVAAYSLFLQQLRSDPMLELSVPVFDRSMELARSCAAVVTADQDIIVTEGNYLLIDAEPWSRLRGLLDLTVWVEAPATELEARILQRWDEHGLTPAEARERWEHNDRPNAEFVVENSRPADVEAST